MTCNSRIKYQKVCPIHGEVSQDEIVSGYEYSKGQYVVIDPAEIDKLRTESDKSVNITAFVRRRHDRSDLSLRPHLLPGPRWAGRPESV